YVHLASRRKGNTGEVLLQLLEQRLDNVVRRAGFTRTIWAARQMVVHGHVLVNGHPVDRPSCTVNRGDLVTLRPRIHNLAKDNMESMAGHVVPGWMGVNPAELSIKMLSAPTREEIPFDVNTNLIVEFYR
ncbi:MAG: 30S ribosomal protein S4, partial [Planctomycetota bacterium]